MRLSGSRPVISALCAGRGLLIALRNLSTGIDVLPAIERGHRGCQRPEREQRIELRQAEPSGATGGAAGGGAPCARSSV